MYLEHAESDDFDRVVVDVLEDGGETSKFLAELVEGRILFDQRVHVRLGLERDQLFKATSDRRRKLYRLSHFASYQIHYLQ